MCEMTQEESAKIVGHIDAVIHDLKRLRRAAMNREWCPWTTALEEIREQLDGIDGKDPYPTKIPYPGEGWDKE